MPQGHYMKKSLGRVKKGNDKGKFKLEVTKVIKYEASESTGNLLREVATKLSRGKIDLILRNLDTHTKTRSQ